MQERASDRADSKQRADDVYQQLAALRQALEGRKKAVGAQIFRDEVRKFDFCRVLI